MLIFRATPGQRLEVPVVIFQYKRIISQSNTYIKWIEKRACQWLCAAFTLAFIYSVLAKLLRSSTILGSVRRLASNASLDSGDAFFSSASGFNCVPE